MLIVVTALNREGVGWCEALNLEFNSWPAVRGHLKTEYKNAFDSFVGLEKIDESKLSDIRLARKAGGFAFEFWCQGGDIEDIDQLLKCFSTILGTNESTCGLDAVEEQASKGRVFATIKANVGQTLGRRHGDDVWSLSMEERQQLPKKWKDEVNPCAIIDQTAEVHRRHQSAVLRMKETHQKSDSRCLAQHMIP